MIPSKTISTNNQEEKLYKEEFEGEAEGEGEEQRDEEENEYIQNRENGNDNGENIDFLPYQKETKSQNSNKMDILKTNLQYEEDNNDIIQGINLINKKEINTNQKKEQSNYENEKNDKNPENEKNEYDYNYMNHNFLNINENTNPINESNTKDELFNELLNKIHKIKEKRAKNNNKKFNETNKINDLDNIDNQINIDLEKAKINNKKEYIGKFNINNLVFQNNPKMKELANLLKEYNQEKNQNDKIQINFDNNNQINILKPEVYFNIYNNSKNINNDYNEQNHKKKYYISAIDGKAIVNGQRLDVNSGFKNQNTFMNSNYNDFNNNKSFFGFNCEKFMDKKKYFKNWGSNLDFQLNNLNFSNNENITKRELGNDNKIEFKKRPKYNLFSRDYYNEELNKINDNLFNMDKNLNK